MRRSGIEIVIELLHVLAVIALFSTQPEQPFLQDRIAPVPEHGGEAEQLVPIADAGDAVLVPAVRARAGVLEREILPGGALGAVVLAHGAPTALGQVRAPALPVGRALARLQEPLFFAGDHRGREYNPAHGPVRCARACSHSLRGLPRSRPGALPAPLPRAARRGLQRAGHLRHHQRSELALAGRARAAPRVSVGERHRAGPPPSRHRLLPAAGPPAPAEATDPA